MKTTIKNFSRVVLVAFTIFSLSIITSCSKDGAIGPAGPAGINGTDGTNGTNGTNSNVNVISTPWTTRTFTGSGSNWTVTFPVSSITPDILSSGLLLTYRKVDTGETVQVTNQVSPYFWVYYLVGNIEFDATSNQTAQYRHIIIPRFSSTIERNTNNADYSKMSYHEICTKFKIPE